MTSEFLQMLDEPDLTTAHTAVAQEFMAMKGYPHIRPFGVTEVGTEAWYFYYELPEGILEVEVARNFESGTYQRVVSAFVTDPKKVRELLGT